MARRDWLAYRKTPPLLHEVKHFRTGPCLESRRSTLLRRITLRIPHQRLRRIFALGCHASICLDIEAPIRAHHEFLPQQHAQPANVAGLATNAMRSAL
jgi:hypothetical protein